MILIEPAGVTIDGVPQEGVLVLAVEESGVAPIEERDDPGPYAVFADCPARQVRVTLRQEVGTGALAAPRCGEMVEIGARMSPAGAEAGQSTLRVRGCVVEVGYDLTGKVPARALTLIGVSDDGVSPPLSVV